MTVDDRVFHLKQSPEWLGSRRSLIICEGEGDTCITCEANQGFLLLCGQVRFTLGSLVFLSTSLTWLKIRGILKAIYPICETEPATSALTAISQCCEFEP